MDTLRSFKRCGAKGFYRQICTGITRPSAVLYRLLTQTIKAPKERNRTVKSDKYIKRKSGKKTIASKIEKSRSSSMWFKHSMSIAEQLILIYNTTVHKN